MRIVSGINKALDWLTSLDLELRILGSSEVQSSGCLHDGRRNEPSAAVTHQHKEVIDPGRIEMLRGSLPALVSAVGCDAHTPAIATIGGTQSIGRSLDLDSKKTAFHLCHQVYVGAVTEWDPDKRSFACQPLHR